MLIAIFALRSCKSPVDLTFSNKPAFELDVIKIVSYEVESVTTRITEGGNANEISQIRAMPAIDRTAVRYGVDKFGATEIFIDILVPQQQLPADAIPPNTFVEAKHIHIVHGIGSFYDANQILLYTQPMDNSSIAPIDNLAANKDDFNDMLENAQTNGAIINDLGNGHVSVRMSAQQLETEQNNTASDDTYAVTIYNKLNNAAIGTVIYDNSDTELFRVYVKTETNTSGDLVLKATQQEVFDLNPITNLTTVIKTNSVYSNVIIEDL